MILLVSLIIPSVTEPRFTLLFYSPLQLQPDSSHTSTPCQVLPMFKDRESTASLGSLFQCFTTFTENCFSLYLIIISQAVTYIHCLLPSNSKRNLILYCLLSPTVQLRQQLDPPAAFSPRLHKASSLNITFHTKMLQPPPFLGNPSLDLLCFATEHSTPGSSGLLYSEKERPPSDSWNTGATHYVASTASRKILHSLSKHS